MPFLTTGELTVHYQFDAAPEKPVLMLSNSLGTDFSMWDPQAAIFAEHFSLLRYDTRGHGQSSAPPGPYSIEQMGRDVLALLDELKLSRVHFCGLSMGGMIGQWLGAHAQERVHSLVLADTAAKVGDDDFWNDRIQTGLRRGMAAAVPFFVEGWFTEPFRKSSPDVVERIASVYRRMSPEAFAACCAALRDMDLRADLAKICAPTLVVYGAHDMAIPPSESLLLVEAIAGSQGLRLESAHLSNVESQAAFTKGVLDFLLCHR